MKMLAVEQVDKSGSHYEINIRSQGAESLPEREPHDETENMQPSRGENIPHPYLKNFAP